jgi:hypothetical protein
MDGQSVKTSEQDIIERTDGIPVFVEEMTKAVLEAGSESAAQQVAAIPATALAVPASLHASLIGREFSHALMVAVARKPTVELISALDRLMVAGLLFRQGLPPHTSYLFKHALVQDAAYGTLLREPRRMLHGRIAEILESQFAEIVDNQPELLARHYTAAGHVEKVVSYWLRAGQLAVARSANAESVSHVTTALTLVADWPETTARDRQELDLRTVLGPALIATRGHAADETVENYKRCRHLMRTTDDQTYWEVVLFGLAAAYYNRGICRQFSDIAHEFLQEAKRQGTAVALCVGHRLVSAACTSGNFRDALVNGELAFRHYDRGNHPRLAWRYVHDIGVAAASQWAIGAWHQGLIGIANVAHQEAFAIAARLNHHTTTGYALYYNGVLAAFFRRDFAALAEHDARLREHGLRCDLPQWTALASALEGAALAHAGKVDEGILEIEHGLLLCDRIKDQSMQPVFLAGLAKSQLMAGRYLDAA